MATYVLNSKADAIALKPLADGDYALESFVSGADKPQKTLRVTARNGKYAVEGDASQYPDHKSFTDFLGSVFDISSAPVKLVLTGPSDSDAKAAGAGIGILLGGALVFWYLFYGKKR